MVQSMEDFSYIVENSEIKDFKPLIKRGTSERFKFMLHHRVSVKYVWYSRFEGAKYFPFFRYKCLSHEILRVSSVDNVPKHSSVPKDQEFIVKLLSSGLELNLFSYVLKKDKPLPYTVELLGTLHEDELF